MGKQKDPTVSYNYSTEQENVIPKNAFMSMPMANSIILTAGHSTIWNRDETIMPMSWKLIWTDGITDKGNEYAINTMPTTSTAKEFDVLRNVPDFEAMLKERIAQATVIDDAKLRYMDKNALDEAGIRQLDADITAGEIMDVANDLVKEEDKMMSDIQMTIQKGREWKEPMQKAQGGDHGSYEDEDGNVHTINNDGIKKQKERDTKKNKLCGLCTETEVRSMAGDHVFEAMINGSLREIAGDPDNFTIDSSGNISINGFGQIAHIPSKEDAMMWAQLFDAAKDQDNPHVFAENTDLGDVTTRLDVDPRFINFLLGVPDERFRTMAGGAFYDFIRSDLDMNKSND